MTKMKLSSKMHLFIIISTALIVIGLALGTILHFTSDAFFNYGAELKQSYKTVEVNYAYVDYSDEDKVLEICDGVFDKAGVSYYSAVSGETDEGGRITFKFSDGTSSDKLTESVNGIVAALRGDGENVQSNASVHSVKAQLNGGKVLTYVSIALASAVVLQLLYFMVRYKITMALAAFLANVHNLALYVALLALTRVPVGISAVAFGALTVLLSMVASAYLFDRYRRNLKKEPFTKLDGDEQTDLCVNECFKNILYPTVGVATAAVLIFVMLSISAMSALAVLAPAAAAILCVLSAVYGTVFFMPPVYTRFKRIGDDLKARSKNKK